VHLANRTIERARVLADRFGANVHPVAWDAIDALLPRAGLLVNTTSLGMHGQPALELDANLLPPHAIVADLVYVPLETPLLKAARARGLKTGDGLGMLLYQAVRGFELWAASGGHTGASRAGRGRSHKGLNGNMAPASLSKAS
jgi:shikimate dehydrogenase